jgi:phospholipase C
VDSIQSIEHVVVIMMENRPFDEYFGTLNGVRGFRDTSLPQSIFAQPTAGSSWPGRPAPQYPYHLGAGAQSIPTNDHSFYGQHISWDEGRLDQWSKLPNNSVTAMGYYTNDEIPWHFALARTFTICDNYFCSVLGPTAPNRLYLMSGTIVAPWISAGEETLADGPIIGNPDATQAPIWSWTSYPQALANAGVTWAIYDEQVPGGPQPFNLNVTATFADWQPGQAPTQDQFGTPNAYRAGAGRFDSDLQYPDPAPPPGSMPLPQVSWIVPPYTSSEHPSNPPNAGAIWLNDKISALLTSGYWDSTVLIITYDENDGSFDHVPPPILTNVQAANEWIKSVATENIQVGSLPPTTENDPLGAGYWPIGPGFRVPTFVVSPWTFGGHVCHEQLDHTSILQFLQIVTQNFVSDGVTCDNLSEYRLLYCGDLTTAFDFSDYVPAAGVPRTPSASGGPGLPDPSVYPPSSEQGNTSPPGDLRFPPPYDSNQPLTPVPSAAGCLTSLVQSTAPGCLTAPAGVVQGWLNWLIKALNSRRGSA